MTSEDENKTERGVTVKREKISYKERKDKINREEC